MMFTKVRILGAAAIALLLWGVWEHYTDIRDDRLQLIKDLSSEQVAHVTTKATLKADKEKAENELKQIQASLFALSKKYGVEQEKSDELEVLLSKHDLGYLAYRKPGLIARRINSGTDRVFKFLATETRSFAGSAVKHEGKDDSVPSSKRDKSTTPEMESFKRKADAIINKGSGKAKGSNLSDR